jgi:lysophospholipase L1-like esterase
MRKLFGISLFLNALGIGILIFALVKIGSPRYLYDLVKYRGNGIVNLKKSRTTHLATLPMDTGKIIMLGNSITAEAEWLELFQNPDILNRGIIGDGTGDILLRLDPIIAAKPRQVFLLIGVNDLMFQPVSKILENYEQIVKRLRVESPTTKLYCESVLPIHNSLRRNGLRNEDIDVLNLGIEKIAGQYGARFINLAKNFKNTEGALNAVYSIDGIHLNGTGYLVFRDLIKAYLENKADDEIHSLRNDINN